MGDDYKKIIKIVFAVFFLVFLVGFQISFLNFFHWRFNIILILILFLVLSRNIYSAFFLGWFSGFLIDTVHFFHFGISSLIFILLTGFLVILQKKALITAKNEGVLLMSITAVFFYHFLEWMINGIFISEYEKISFHFLNTGIAVELLFTTILLLVIFNSVHIFSPNNIIVNVKKIKL